MSAETASNVQTVAAATEELSTSIIDIDRRVAEATATAKRGVDLTETSAGAITSLKDSADRIGAVVGLIQSIAEQTNLLALNATIEAARAGESGRGFAIVANEVKALATQTARATEDISSHITAMQTATTSTVDAIGEIGKAIQSIDQITALVAEAIQAQGAATTQIAANVSDVAHSAAAVDSDVALIGQMVRETADSAQVVRQVADQAKQQIDVLGARMGDFFREVSAA